MKPKFYLIEELTNTKRNFDVSELWQSLRRLVKVCSWGARPTNFRDKALCLKVDANHFDGVVVITLAGNDTFCVDYVKEQIILDSKENIYIEDLVDTIDLDIEYVKSYTF